MSAGGQEHGASRVLGPVFTPAGRDDASVKEEIQGPGQDLEGPRDAFQEAVSGDGVRGEERSQWAQKYGGPCALLRDGYSQATLKYGTY